MATRPMFPGTIKNAGLDIENADGTTTQSLLTADTGGARVDRISVTSDDTSDVVLNFYYYDGATDFLLGSVTITTLAGTNGGVTPAISALNSTDMPWLGSDLAMYLEGGDSIRVAAQTAVTAAKKIQVVAQYGDY